MTTDTCTELRTSLGAYVLGALDVESRAEVERHISICTACRDELAALAGMPAVLTRLTEDDLHDGEQLPTDLLDRTLAELRAQRRRTTRRTRILAVAAGVVILAGGGGGLAATMGGSGSSATEITATSPNGAISVSYRLQSRTTGTAITLWLHGVSRGQTCRLITVSRSGATETAASWTADYQGRVDIDATTSFARQDLAQLRIVDGDGKELVSTAL